MTKYYKYWPIEMNDFSKHVDHFIKNNWPIRGFLPPSDIFQDDKGVTMNIEMPGIKKEDIAMDVSPEGVLTIKGYKTNHKDEKTKDYRLNERFSGSFERSFTIGRDYDFDKIEANLNEGVLRIFIPNDEKLSIGNKKVEIH